MTREGFVRSAFAAFCALALVLGTTGCSSGFPYQIVSVTPDEVEQGEQVRLRVLLFRLQLEPPFVDDVTIVGNSGVQILSNAFTGLAPDEVFVDLLVPDEEHTPLDPFQLELIIFLEGQGLRPEERVSALTGPIYIHKRGAGPAPRITSFSPATLRRNVREAVTINGVNFDATARLLLRPRNASAPLTITIGNQGFDAASGTLQATLIVPESEPLGEAQFYVETAAGRSTTQTFMVVGTPPPTITELFPNSITIGEQETVLVTGTEFHTEAVVQLDPVGSDGDVQPARIIIDPLSGQRDTRSATVRLMGEASGSAPLRVDSVGGLSSPALLEVSTAFLGSAPRIKRVTPAEVFAGTTSQVVVEVEGIDAPRMTELHLVPDTATASGELLPTTRRPTTTRVVRLATERTGSFDLALSSDTGRTTNAKPIKVVAPPPGMPFVSGTAGGRISLGSRQIGDTINGARLARAREIRFNPPVITASITSNTDSAIGVSLDAAPTGDLSGDVRTTFRVRTDVGWSNEADYVVTDDNVRFPDFLTPHLERVFPNFVYPGPLKSHFFAISNVLAPPAALVVDPAAAVREPRVTDLTAGQFPGRFLALEMFVPAPAVPTSLSLAVTNTSGGTTNPQPIRVLGPGGPRGPEITGMETTAQGYFSSTISQFRIVGRNFGPPETMALVFADRTGRPASLRRGLQIFAPTAERADGLDSVVVQFATQRETEARTEYIALAVDGLESNLAGEFTRMPPPATGPFITGLARGEVTRPPIGSPPLATFSFDEIQGVGLESVDRIEFDSPGISGGVILEQFPFSTFRGVSFRVEPDAALTGDAITTFRVFTTDGRRSNTVGIIVKP